MESRPTRIDALWDASDEDSTTIRLPAANHGAYGADAMVLRLAFLKVYHRSYRTPQRRHKVEPSQSKGLPLNVGLQAASRCNPTVDKNSIR